MAQFFLGGKFSNLTFWAFFDHFGQICSFWPISPKRYYKCSSFSPYKHIFWCFKKWRKKFWGENSQNWLFGRILTKIWPFWAKYAHFGPFLPNATRNCSNFWHRNIFFALLKNDANFFGGKILKIDFLGVFWPKFDHFEPNMLISAHFSQTLL